MRILIDNRTVNLVYMLHRILFLVIIIIIIIKTFLKAEDEK